MTHDEYLSLIKRLRMTPRSFAEAINLSNRQSQRFAYGDSGVNHQVAILLRLLAMKKITVKDLEQCRP